MIRNLSRRDDKTFSANHDVLAAGERKPELGCRHTPGQRRVEFSNMPRPQRPGQSFIGAVTPYADALATSVTAPQAGKPVQAKERAALRRASTGVDHIDGAIRRDIRYLIVRDDRAWQALVELSGRARAGAGQPGARGPATRTGERNAQSHELAQTRPATRAPLPRKRFAELTPVEKDIRRAEFRAQQGHNAGLEDTSERVKSGIGRSRPGHGLE